MGKQSDTPSLKKNIILNTIYQVLVMLIPFITAPYISRVIGTEGVGIYSYTYSIEMFFGLFAVLGTQTYGIREIARARDDKKQLSKVFWEIELLTVVTTAVVLLAWMIWIVLSDEYRIYYLILTLYLFNAMFDISWLFAGLEQFKYSITKNSIFKILGAVLIFVFIKKPQDLALYIFIMGFTALLGTITMWIPLRKFVSFVNPRELNIFRHFKEVLVYFVPTIATSIYTILDKSLIGLITHDPLENGYYEQATKVVNMVKTITFTSLNTVLGARISYLFSQNKEDEIRAKIHESIEFILLAGFGFTFGLIGTAQQFIPWFFGKGYEEVVPLVKIMSPLIIIIGISNCLGFQYYNPAGLRKKSAQFIIIGSVVNLILNVTLIPKYNSIGAVIASIIAEIVISGLYLRFCNGYLVIYDLVRLGWKKAVAGVGMLGLLIGLNRLQFDVFGLLVLKVVLGVICYILILLILRDRFFGKMVKKVIGKVK